MATSIENTPAGTVKVSVWPVKMNEVDWSVLATAEEGFTVSCATIIVAGMMRNRGWTTAHKRFIDE
jgi:hypothetical protein